jgi:hypothetical protein
LSWSLVGSAPEACPYLTVVAVSPESSETLYAGTVIPTLRQVQCGGVYRSLDGGGTWTPFAAADEFVTSVLLDPRDPQRIFVAAIRCCGFFSSPGGVLQSSNGGSSWKDLNLYFGAAGLSLSSSGDILYAASGGVQSLPLRRPAVAAPRASN